MATKECCRTGGSDPRPPEYLDEIFKEVAFLMNTKSNNEPRHDKTNKVSVRPVNTQISLIRVRCPHEETLGL